jgi:hypothetical protein
MNTARMPRPEPCVIGSATPEWSRTTQQDVYVTVTCHSLPFDRISPKDDYPLNAINLLLAVNTNERRTMRSYTLTNKQGLFIEIFLIALVTPCSVLAIPNFTWEGPWTVTFIPRCLPSTVGGAEQCTLQERGFGISARNGEADVLADQVFAQAAGVRGNPNASNVASVEFLRQYRLSGSPQGWIVTLEAVLKGRLVAGPNTIATVNAHVPGVVEYFDALSAGPESSETRVYNERFHRTRFEPDGVGGLYGQLITNEGGGTMATTARAFFGQNLQGGESGFGLQVILQATPVPDVSSVLTFTTGLAALLVNKVARRVAS